MNTFQVDAPLFPGYGTHFVYVYVGTPPQRVSVIVDTGSHYTAFPCSGCEGCGSHTDGYFDFEASSTAKLVACSDCHVATCHRNQCIFSQSYSEGSSWEAREMTDQFWVGGKMEGDLEPENVPYSIEMLFGCQRSETGMFRTQLADGIMGMSQNAFSLVDNMHRKGVIHKNAFSVCFKASGGVLSLGGIDERLHQSPMMFTGLTKFSGWFTVHLDDILIGGQSIDVDSSVYNFGKGVILDSGTTDTYLSQFTRTKFMNLWSTLAKVPFNNDPVHFTKVAISKLPVITFVFDGDVRVDMRPEQYMEPDVGTKFTTRIYLDEWEGVVLGAKFMTNHDVFFDREEKKVGFAPSSCDQSLVGTGAAERDVDCQVHQVLLDPCDAQCDEEMARLGAEAWGQETWGSVVSTKPSGAGELCPDFLPVGTRDCMVECGQQPEFSVELEATKIIERQQKNSRDANS